VRQRASGGLEEGQKFLQVRSFVRKTVLIGYCAFWNQFLIEVFNV